MAQADKNKGMQRITCPSLATEEFVVLIRHAQLLHANRDHQGADGESQAELMDRGTDTASKASSDQEHGEEAGHGLSSLGYCEQIAMQRLNLRVTGVVLAVLDPENGVVCQAAFLGDLRQIADSPLKLRNHLR